VILGENMVPLLAYFIDLFIIHFLKKEIKRFRNFLVFVQILGQGGPKITKTKNGPNFGTKFCLVKIVQKPKMTKYQK